MKPNLILLFLVSLVIATPGLGQVETLSLEHCIELAIENNNTLRKSLMNVEQASVSKRQSYSELFPSLTISASGNNSKTSQMGSDWESQWSLQKTAEQAIYRPGLFSNIKQAGINEQIAKISSAETESQIRLLVKNLYFQILSSNSLIAVYQENIQSSAENLEKIRLMFKVGAKTESDVLKAEVQKGNFESQLLTEQQNLLSYKRQLNSAMGRSPLLEFQIVSLSADSVDVPAFNSAQQMLLPKNRNFQMLKKQEASSALAVSIAKEAFLPSFSGYYTYSKSDDFTSTPGFSTDQFGLRVSINLFNGCYKRLNVQQQKLSLNSASIELSEEELQLYDELANLYTNLDTNNKQIELNVKSVQAARRDLDLVSERYAHGASTILDQMTAQASLLESQSNLVKLKYGRKIIEAQIKQLLAME
ncbi:MAG: TolC family protein [Candidatus Zhuqueibacterota bacterium]